MENILIGLAIGLGITILSISLFWSSWKKRGYVWPKTKAEKEEGKKLGQLIIPLAIAVGFILPKLNLNNTVVFSITISWIVSIIILCRKLDSYFRSKHKQ